MRNYSFRDTKWLNKGHELDYIATLIMRIDNEFYLVGTRNEILKFYDRVGKELINSGGKIKGIVLTEKDNSFCIDGIPQVEDVDIPCKISSMIICTSFERSKYEALQQLFEGYGFYENKQFFQAEVFTMIYEVYSLDKICIDRVEIFVTSHCSLKCEKCIAYIPYFSKYEHTPLESLKRDADLFFSKVDYVYKYKILGGEGLMYPHLIEYIEYVGSNYGNRIGSIRIGTNGTIIPSEELLQICNLYGVTMDISDYGCEVADRSKLLEVKKLCEEKNVSVDVKRTGESWLDMGYPKHLPRKKDEDKLRRHFNKCAMFCRDFYDGKYFYCCSNFAATKSGMFVEDSNDYFDFNKDFTKQELLEYELGYSELGHTTFCNVCRGCSDEVNPFHVEVAKQM